MRAINRSRCALLPLNRGRDVVGNKRLRHQGEERDALRPPGSQLSQEPHTLIRTPLPPCGHSLVSLQAKFCFRERVLFHGTQAGASAGARRAGITVAVG